MFIALFSRKLLAKFSFIFKLELATFDWQWISWMNKWNKCRERCRFSLTECGGRLYAIGGCAEVGEDDCTVESYDPNTDLWTPCPGLPGQIKDTLLIIFYLQWSAFIPIQWRRLYYSNFGFYKAFYKLQVYNCTQVKSTCVGDPS